MRKILFSLRRLPSFLKNLGRRIRKAKRTLAFGVIILLLAQVLTVIGYSYAADVKGRGAVSDYGVYSQLEKLLEEKNKRKGSVDAESEERFKEIENEIANFKLRDEDIAQPSTFLEKEASATIGDVNLVTAPPKGAPLPDIFYRAAHDKYKGTEDTIFDNLLANLTRYFIYTEFFPDNNSNGDHFDEPPVKKWTSADFLPSFFNPDQGFKPDLWNGVNIDYNEATGDGDKGFFDEILGSYEEGSDVWVQLRPVIPLIEDILNNPFTKALQLLMQLITDGGELNLTAGFMIEIKKDSEWVNTEREMPLHIALVRGVAYDDLEFNRHEYIWTADFNFSETPQEFNFTVMVEGLSLEINDALALIYELLGLQEPQQSYTFTNIYPPYTVRYNLRNNTNQPNVEENTIENLSLLIGYEKFLKKQGEITRSLVDRTWAKVGVDSYKPYYNYIPRILQIRLFGEKNIIKQLTEYDSITYYANIPANLLAIYSEEKDNDTYVVARVKGAPGGDLEELFNSNYNPNPFKMGSDDLLALKSVDFDFVNLSYKTEKGEHVNKTLIYLNTTEKIHSIYLEGYLHLGGYLSGKRYDYYNISTKDVPTDIELEGSFVFEKRKDPYTVFNNPNMDFLTQVVDNVMLTIASSIYAVGIKLRSLPNALSEMATAGGNATLTIQKKILNPNGKFVGYANDHLSDSQMVYAPGYGLSPSHYAKYLTSSKDRYFVGIYENLLFDDELNRSSLFVSIGGIKNLYYKSVADREDKGNLSRIFFSLNSTIKKPIELAYLEGYGDNYINQDFARVILSGNRSGEVTLPEHLTLEMVENKTIFDFRGSPHPNIYSLFYESSLGGHYLKANVTHIPHYIEMEFSENVTLLNTITEETRDGVKKEEEYFDLSFATTNITFLKDGRLFYKIKEMDGNHVGIFKEGRGDEWYSSISTRLGGIKKIKYWKTNDTTVGSMVHTEMRLKGGEELHLLFNDSVTYTDKSKALNGFLLIKPLPSYFRLDLKEVETKKEVSDVKSEDFDELEDIAIVLDSFEAFTKSLLDVVDEGVNRATAGIGFNEETDWKFAFTTIDPVTKEETNLKITGHLTRGDVEEMYRLREDYTPARWVNGISMRQFILDKKEEKAIYDAKIYISSPTSFNFEIHKHGDNINLSASMTKFGTPHYDNFLLEVRGIDKTDYYLYLNSTKMKKDITAFMNFDINSSADNSTFAGILQLDVRDPESGISLELSRTYLRIKTEGENQSDLRMLVPHVPAPIDLRVSITDSLDLNYKGSATMDYLLLTFQMGDVSQLTELSYWTHGVVLRELEVEDSIIMDGKLFMTGIPKEAEIEIIVVKESETTELAINLVDWNPAFSWLSIDIVGLEKKDFIIYLNGLPTSQPFKMDLKGEVYSNVTENRMESNLSFGCEFELGKMYFKFRNPELEEPLIMEIFVSEIPKKVKMRVILRGEVFVKMSTSSGINLAYIKIAKYVEDNWYDLVAIAHDISTYLKAEIKPNKEFDMDKTIILQGNPDIFVETSSNKVDVFLSLDGKLNWNYGHTTIGVEDVANKTSIVLNKDLVYQIRSKGVGSALIILRDLPITKESYIDELYIYAEDVKSVDIEARMLYGLYPVFKLSNAEGGKVDVEVKMKIYLGEKDVKVTAALVDAQVKSLGPLSLPSIAPLYLNTIATTLSTDHFIVPEPVTTIIVTLFKFLGGLF